jgi:hypothetical protein
MRLSISVQIVHFGVEHSKNLNHLGTRGYFIKLTTQWQSVNVQREFKLVMYGYEQPLTNVSKPNKQIYKKCLATMWR